MECCYNKLAKDPNLQVVLTSNSSTENGRASREVNIFWHLRQILPILHGIFRKKAIDWMSAIGSKRDLEGHASIQSLKPRFACHAEHIMCEAPFAFVAASDNI